MLRFLGVLVLIAAVVLGLALWRGWIDVSAQEGADDKSLTVTVNEQQVQRDTDRTAEAFKRGASDLADKVRKAGDEDAQEVRGSVVQVDPSTREIRLRTDAAALLILRVADDAKLFRDGNAAALADFRVDEEVVATYVVMDGKNVAVAIDRS